MEAKQEVIREAWGSVYNPHICENGWFNMFYLEHVPNMSFFLDENKHFFKGTFVRLKSLQGIENNNFWISVKSEDDLPKQHGAYWTITDGKHDVEANTFGTFGKEEFTFNNRLITHYQPIIKPNLPLHE